MLERTRYYVPDLSKSSRDAVPVFPGGKYSAALALLGIEPNCVGSLLAYGKLHAPTLDVDFPCELVPSSTPGHFHRYIDAVAGLRAAAQCP